MASRKAGSCRWGRSLGKIARKVDVSLVAGFTFSSFNSKRTSDIQAQLTTLTDIYSLNGQLPPATPSSAAEQPASRSFTIRTAIRCSMPSGRGSQSTVDQSILLSLSPTRTNSNTNADGTPTTAEVRVWQIKGAYYTFRLGPVFQLPVTERLKLSLGFGAAVVFAGSTYTSGQTVAVDNVTTMSGMVK